jgi:hypothetical protein
MRTKFRSEILKGIEHFGSLGIDAMKQGVGWIHLALLLADYSTLLAAALLIESCGRMTDE